MSAGTQISGPLSEDARARSWLPEAVIVAVTLAIYARSLSFQFVFDDLALIVHNPTIQSWKYFSGYFTRDLWQNVQPATGYYRPLVLLWFRLNDALFGLQPAWWHLTTVLLHAVASVLVLRLTRRLTCNPRLALLAGLLFAIHPVHVETVAWVSDVVDALVTVWFLAAVLCFIRSRSGSRTWLLASLLCYAGAMLSKEPGITLPAVLFLYVFLFERRSATEPWSSRITHAFTAIAWFIPLAIVYLFARHHALHAFSVQMQTMTTTSAILSMPALLWQYVHFLVLPIGLSPFYDLSVSTLSNWHAIFIPLVGVLAVSGLCWLVIHRSDESRRMGLFALGWALITLAPALDLPAFPSTEMIHDRYIYLASVGFCMLAAIVLDRLRLANATSAFPLPAVIVLLLLAALSFHQQQFWRDEAAIFSRAVEIAPHNDNAESGLATIVAKQGNYPLAISLYTDILKRNPDHFYANLNLGWTDFLLGNYQDAEHYLVAAALRNRNRSDVFFDLGVLYLKTDRLDLALASLTRAQSLSPPHPLIHEKISEVLEKQGDLAGAVHEMQVATQLAPGDRNLAARLAELRAKAGLPG